MQQQPKPTPKNPAQQLQILKLKLDLMQIWCIFFYNNDHRCLMNLLCALTLDRKQITLKNVQGYRNYINLLTELESGFLITQTDKKIEKTKEIRINLRFFQILPELLSTIKTRINPQIQKIKKFNPKQKKKICKNCKTQKTQSQLRFFGNRCECSTPQFIDIILDPAIKSRLEQLQKLIQTVIKLLSTIELKQSEFEKVKRSQKQQKEKQVSELDKFMAQVRANLRDRGIDVGKLEKNYSNLTEAYQQYAPRKIYGKVEEMKEVRARRGHRAQNMGD